MASAREGTSARRVRIWAGPLNPAFTPTFVQAAVRLRLLHVQLLVDGASEGGGTAGADAVSAGAVLGVAAIATDVVGKGCVNARDAVP